MSCHAGQPRLQNHDLVYFHLNDYIDDVQNRVLESRFRAYPILDENERVVGMLSRFHLLRPRRKRVVLMDHNERAQSVAGLEQAEILEIVDHHRLADIETKTPSMSAMSQWAALQPSWPGCTRRRG